MVKAVFDWTWTNKNEHGDVFVELDVLIEGDYQLPLIANPTITEVKAIFTKHGKRVLRDIPDDLKRRCIADLNADDAMFQSWLEHISQDADQEASETRDEYRRSHRED